MVNLTAANVMPPLSTLEPVENIMSNTLAIGLQQELRSQDPKQRIFNTPMNINNENTTPPTTITTIESSPRQATVWPWLLAGALAISLGANFYQSQKTTALSTDVGALRTEMATVKNSLKDNEAQVKKSISGVEESLEATKQELTKKVAATQQTRVIVQRQVAAATAQIDNKWKKEHSETVAKINGDIAQVKDAALANQSKLSDMNNEVGAVKTDVGAVKTEIASTRSELDRTISDLKRVRGDMGEMSGLIATNSKEVGALRELGERNYYEFSLTKSAGQQRVGDIQLSVKKADLKRSKYTLDVVVDDRHIQKKDKTVNEPVQFYVSTKTRQPYELVVYEVQKDRIVGYLATPKVQVARK
jgi:predicted  nucleic acid-binding Zn-ribbon protein